MKLLKVEMEQKEVILHASSRNLELLVKESSEVKRLSKLKERLSLFKRNPLNYTETAL